MLDKIDCIYLEGAMAFTFLKAQDCNVGDSYYDEVSVQRASKLLALCKEKMVRVYFPEAVIATPSTQSKSKVFPFYKYKAWMDGLRYWP